MKKVFIFLLILILALAGGGYYLSKNYLKSSETSTKYKEFSFICEDKDIGKDDFDRVDGQFYLSLDFIKEYIDDSVHYDKNEKTVVFVNDSGTKRVTVGKKDANLNGQEIGLRSEILEKNNKIMVPIEIFIYDYPVELRYNGDKKVLVLDFKNVEYAKGISPGDGLNMREKDSTRSPIVSILKKGEEVYVYGEVGDFYKVREIDGYLGYIAKSKLDVEFPKNRFRKEKAERKKEAKRPLNLTWDYTYSVQSDDSIEAINSIKGLNVICPTWFSIQNENGDIIDRGRIEYVNKYNELGIDVWAYLDNSFKSDLTHNVLSKSSLREKIIKRTLELTKKYNLKGINIDFEHTYIEDRELITQFVRELAGVFRRENLIVSVDVTPQISSNVEKEPYNRAELAKICDYVMLMAYDQHWSSSETAGSVAEYKWVEGNINVLLRQIPKEKFILGIPLYSRLWSEQEDKVKSSSLSMNQVKNLLDKRGVTPKWDEELKQDYAEYKENGKDYKVWIEDAKSLSWKVSLVNKYNLNGVASWRKGFESDDVWKEIDSVLSKIKH